MILRRKKKKGFSFPKCPMLWIFAHVLFRTGCFPETWQPQPRYSLDYTVHWDIQSGVLEGNQNHHRLLCVASAIRGSESATGDTLLPLDSILIRSPRIQLHSPHAPVQHGPPAASVTRRYARAQLLRLWVGGGTQSEPNQNRASLSNHSPSPCTFLPHGTKSDSLYMC